MEHSMQTIARTGSLPMTKATIPAEGADARMQASNLCAEVFAYLRTGTPWRSFAIRIINGTPDMRAAFVKLVKEQVKDMRKNNAEAVAALGRDGKPDPSKEDTRAAAKRVSSATTEASNLATIANAFNGAATVEGLCEYANQQGRVKDTKLDDVGYVLIVEYARLFNDSQGRGRPADPFMVKLSKWLEKNPAGEGDTDGAAFHAELSKTVAAKVAAMMKVM